MFSWIKRKHDRPPLDFPGGVHVPDFKLTADRPIQVCPLPEVFIVPLKQHIGEPCAPMVDVGEKVYAGQKIGRSQGYVSAAIHAPTSGKVVKIEEHPVPHPSGLGRLCVFIESDGEDRWVEAMPTLADYRNIDPAEIRERIRLSGIVGLGGAVFPSFIKLIKDDRHPIDTVILNGVECEPYLTCDHRLMLEHAREILVGLDIIMHAVGAKRGLIAVEDNKMDAAQHLSESLAKVGGLGSIEVRVLPTKYPQGSEKQLIYALTHREVPQGKLPMHVGVICHNVATAKAIYDAVWEGRPLVERVVTVSGDAVPDPGNQRVRIGTPLRFLLAQHGFTAFDSVRIIHGGPMMGEMLPVIDVPVVKSSNAFLAMKEEGLHSLRYEAQPCIRCGHCVQVCPVGLLPNELAWYASIGKFERALEYDLFECIECGCCSYVCPSHIPLVHYFRYAKGQVAQIEREKAFARLSKERAMAREERLKREQMERKAKRAALHKRKPGEGG